MEITAVPNLKPEDLENNFYWVILLFVATALQYQILVMTVTMSARVKAFTKDFMSAFNDEHAVAFGANTKAADGGYPDTGNGRYAAKLPYASWVNMNNGQRAQHNFLEQLTYLLVSIFIISLAEPVWAYILLAVQLFGRFCYTFGYAKFGPKGRVVGALFIELGHLAALIMMILAIVRLASDLKMTVPEATDAATDAATTEGAADTSVESQ